MKIKEILHNFFGKRQKADAIFYSVKCNKCGEIINVRINPGTDLVSSFGEEVAGNTAYILKKEVLGNNCRNIINIKCRFDSSLNEIDRNISETGTFV
ncbi:MAG: hypothetical protein PHO00_02380 [bacterium]|nr:hypothetical protein [bacterium]